MKDYLFSFSILALVIAGYTALVLGQRSTAHASHETPMASVAVPSQEKPPTNQVDPVEQVEFRR